MLSSMEKISDYLSIKEAAQYLGVCSDTLRRWDRVGKLRTIRHPLNNYRLYSRADLDQVLQAIKGELE